MPKMKSTTRWIAVILSSQDVNVVDKRKQRLGKILLGKELRSPQILVGRMKIRIWVDRLGRDLLWREKTQCRTK